MVQRADWWGRSLPRPLLAVPIVTAHPSTVSVPIAVLLYGPLLCGFNAAFKWLTAVNFTIKLSTWAEPEREKAQVLPVPSDTRLQKDWNKSFRPTHSWHRLTATA